MLGHSALVCGQPLSMAFENAAVSFECQIHAQEMYGFDGGPIYGYASLGGWEFGGQIQFPRNKYVGAPLVTRNPVQTDADALRLEAPRAVAEAGAVPIALEFARLQAQHGLLVSYQLGCPFTAAGSVIGEQRMLEWMIEKPALVHRVLDKVCDFSISLTELFVKEFGGDRLTAIVGAALVSNSLISPRQFETFALPYYQRVHRRAIDLGVSTFFVHICGDQNLNLHLWRQVPLTRSSILSFGHEIPLETAMAMFPDQIIAGNVDPAVIEEGKPEDVLGHARNCVVTGKHHKGGFVLMAGCDLPPHAHPANVYMMAKAAREWGQY